MNRDKKTAPVKVDDFMLHDFRGKTAKQQTWEDHNRVLQAAKDIFVLMRQQPKVG